MRNENRIDFPIPSSTVVCKGFRNPIFGFEASPGDMIVENINNALGSKFLGMDRIPDLPGSYPFKGLMAKWYIVRGMKTDNEYLVTITDEGIITEHGGDIMGSELVGYKMFGDNVERVVACYRDFNVRQGTINEFLGFFLK